MEFIQFDPPRLTGNIIFWKSATKIIKNLFFYKCFLQISLSTMHENAAKCDDIYLNSFLSINKIVSIPIFLVENNIFLRVK